MKVTRNGKIMCGMLLCYVIQCSDPLLQCILQAPLLKYLMDVMILKLLDWFRLLHGLPQKERAL